MLLNTTGYESRPIGNAELLVEQGYRVDCVRGVWCGVHAAAEGAGAADLFGATRSWVDGGPAEATHPPALTGPGVLSLNASLGRSRILLAGARGGCV